MKKSFKKVLAVLLSVAMLVCGTSLTVFAADEGTSEEMENISNALFDWINALATFDMGDFNEFVTAVLGLFGFTGSFEGVHSIPALVDEWFSWLGDLGGLYESIINFIDTAQLVEFINGLLTNLGQ